MRLSYLRLEGFRCFPEAQLIEFPPAGIVPIVGSRADGGSSGSGKTSVLQAIAMGLGFSSFSASAQQSWLTKTPMQIVIGLEAEDGSEKVDIYRGKKTKAMVNGQEVASGATETNKWLTTYFGMDPKLLQTLTFRPQRRGGLFLGLSPSEKRAFLASVLRLGRFEDMAKKLGEEISQLQREVAIQESAINMAPKPPVPSTQRVESFEYADGIVKGTFEPDWSKVQNDYESARLDAEARLKALDQQKVNHEQQQVAFNARVREQVEDVQKRLRAELATVVAAEPEVGEITMLLEVVGTRLQALGKRERELKTERANVCSTQAECLTQLYDRERDLTQATFKLRDARALRDALKEQQCHTCGQAWVDDNKLLIAENDYAEAGFAEIHAKEAVDVLVLKKAEANVALVGIDAKLAKISEGIEKLRGEHTSLTGKLQAAKWEAQKAADQRREAIREAYATEDAGVRRNAMEGQDLHQKKVTELWNAVETAKREVYQIEAKADAMRQRIASIRRQNESIGELWAVYNSAALRLQAAEAKLQEQTKTLQEKQDLQAATRAFVGAISEEVLAEIRDEANFMLAVLPNVKGVGIRFTTETLNAAGALKQEIRTIFTYGAEDNIDPEAQLSGGQLTSVELAVDRAVGKVLRRRHGGFRLPSWMALDESFDGHDLVTKEACLDFLRTETADSQILVIDHASEFREAFDHTIVVTAGDNGSTISFT